MIRKTYSVMVVHEIPSKLIADWIVTAFEGGSNYWIESADSAERTGRGWKPFDSLAAVKIKLGVAVDASPIYSIPMFWEDTHNGYIIELIDEEPVEHVLTPNRIVAGIQAMTADRRHEEVARLLNEEYDANDADTLLQYALFSEVVYG